MTISEINEALNEIMSGVGVKNISADGAAVDIYEIAWPMQWSLPYSVFQSFMTIAFYPNVNRDRKAFARVMITSPDGSSDLYDFNSVESDLMRLTDSHQVDLLVEKYSDLLLNHNPVRSVLKNNKREGLTEIYYLKHVLFSGIMIPGETETVPCETKFRSLGVKTMLELEVEFFAALIIKSFVKLYTIHIGAIPTLV